MKLEDVITTDKNIYNLDDVQQTICGYVGISYDMRDHEIEFMIERIDEYGYWLTSPHGHLADVQLNSKILSYQTRNVGDYVTAVVSERGRIITILSSRPGHLPNVISLSLQALDINKGSAHYSASNLNFYVDKVDGEYCYIGINNSYKTVYKVAAPRTIFTSGSFVDVVVNKVKLNPTDHNGHTIVTLNFKLRTF